MKRGKSTRSRGRSAKAPASLNGYGRGTISPSGEIRAVRLADIRLDARNPRTDGAEGLDELAASLRGAGLVQPPILIPENGGYRVLVGERRVRAARQAGLKEIACLVSEPLDPLAAHRTRVAENLHRQALNPLDHALALRIAWLLANAEALGLRGEAERVMSKDRPLTAILPGLENLLEKRGFRPTAPAVTWDETLDALGVEMTATRRKKLLRLLSMPRDVQEQLRALPVTEAAARALGRLGEDDQRRVAEAIAEQPDLARRARRIARAVYDQGYSVEDALAEARGEFVPAPKNEERQEAAFANDQAAVDAVMRFLDAANQMMAALEAVRAAAPQTLDIPDPWRGYFQDALEMVREGVQ